MAVQCSHCGETLLGAVNRCWHCGHELQVATGEDDVPPVRRLPHAPDEPALSPAKPLVARSGGRSPRRRPILPRYPQNVFAESCAITSLVLGVLMAVMSFVTVWTLVSALLGVVLGVVGLGSRRRATAILGIGLCSLAFLVSATRAGITAYQDYQQQQNEIWDEF